MAEDIAQEAFLQAYRSLGSFRHESSFSTWLTRIVVNKSLDHCRRTRHLPSPHDPRVLSNTKTGPEGIRKLFFWKRKKRLPSEKKS
jgi:RNA polymerase sigma factor (sigma-70 family)